MVSRKDRRQFLQWGLKSSVLLGAMPVLAFQTNVEANSSVKVLDVSDDRRLAIQSGEGWLFSGAEATKPRTLAMGASCGSSSGSSEGGCSSASAASGGSNCGASGGGAGCGSCGSSKGMGGSCFIAETLVLNSSEKWVPIKSLCVGQSVLGRNGQANMIVEIEKVSLAGRSLYGFESDKLFFTNEHPFWTSEGWAAISPSAFKAENAFLQMPKKLVEGAQLMHKSEGWYPLHKLSSETPVRDQIVYNLILSGDSTYWANGFLVHNKH